MQSFQRLAHGSELDFREKVPIRPCPAILEFHERTRCSFEIRSRQRYIAVHVDVDRCQYVAIGSLFAEQNRIVLMIYANQSSPTRACSLEALVAHDRINRAQGPANRGSSRSFRDSGGVLPPPRNRTAFDNRIIGLSATSCRPGSPLPSHYPPQRASNARFSEARCKTP